MQCDPLTNAFTIDVEDYFQVSAFAPYIPRDHWDSKACRVEGNVDRILQIMARTPPSLPLAGSRSAIPSLSAGSSITAMNWPVTATVTKERATWTKPPSLPISTVRESCLKTSPDNGSVAIAHPASRSARKTCGPSIVCSEPGTPTVRASTRFATIITVCRMLRASHIRCAMVCGRFR